MRRGAFSVRPKVLAIAALALLAAILLVVFVDRLRQSPRRLAPAELDKIADRNRNAAAEAAAVQRAESAASTNAADNRLESQQRADDARGGLESPVTPAPPAAPAR